MPWDGGSPRQVPPADSSLSSHRSSCAASPSSSSSWATSSPPSVSSTRRFRTRTRTRRRIEVGHCGGLDCFSPLAPSPVPISSIPSGLWCLIPFLGGPGVGQSLEPAPGQSLGSLRGWICSWTVPVLPTGLDPCWSHSPGVRSTLHLPSWPHSTCKGQDAWDSHSPPFYWDFLWMLVLPTPRGQNSVQGLPHTAPGVLEAPPFPPQPCSQASPCVLRAEALGAASSLQGFGFQGCPSSSFPSIHREGAAGAQEGWEQQEPGPGLTLELCKQHPGLAAPEAAHVKIKGRSCPGPAWEQLPHSALQLWFIRKWVLTQPP